MTTLPRAMTAPELALIRSNNQSSRVYLTVHQPATIYSARLAAVPTSTDQVTSVTYNSGSGTYTNVLADMTMYVGTSAGAYDLGMVRIRNTIGIAATSGTFNIAEESEIKWQANAYLTVVDEFTIWPRHIRLAGTTPYMDYNVAYSIQNSSCDSIPVMGQHRVLWLEKGSTTVSTTFDGADSWTLNNNITTYAWACATASASSGTTTATPTFTFNALGVHRVSLTITNDDSVSFTGYRYVFVVKSSESQTTTLSTDYILSSNFVIDSLQGDYETGGWSCTVTMYDNADRVDVRDRALVIIHTRDTYGSSGSSIGFVNGAENILYIGWIAGETIRRSPEDLYGSVSFTIEGVQYWLGRIPAFPVGLKDVSTTPTKWTRFWGLTPKAAVWHMLHWRTTITRCTDVFPLDNSWRAARIEAPGAQTLWEQLNTLEYTTVLAKPCADRFGRLHNQVDQQFLEDAAREDIPDVMTITTADITGDVEIERRTVDDVSIVDLSGFSYNGTTGTPYFSLSPGRVFRNYGSAPEVVDHLVLYNQATTNTLCGRYSGWRNNDYPRVSLMFASNQRFVDIAPYSFFPLTVSAAQTPRGIAESFHLIPRRVVFEYNNDGGYFLTRVDFENEATADLAITGDAPEIIPDDPPIDPIIPPVPPEPEPITKDAKFLWLVHSNGASNPALAVIYSDLSTMPSNTYTALIPPTEFYLDSLRYGGYSADHDQFLVVGHSTNAPPVLGSPGFAGGDADVLMVIHNATTASPTWELAAWGWSGMVAQKTWTSEVLPARPQADSRHSHTTQGVTAMALATDVGQCIMPYLGGKIGGMWGSGQRVIANEGEAQWPKFLHRQLFFSSATGEITDGSNTSTPDVLSDVATYTYQAPFCDGELDHLIRLHFLRRNKTTGALQIVYYDLIGSSFDGSTLTITVEYTDITETYSGDPGCYYSNTMDLSNYQNLILVGGASSALYYYISGAWAKADGTVPQGYAHYLLRNGGNGVMWVVDGILSSGNVPAKYTTDITDITGHAWTDLTQNMWNDPDKIMQSGDLNVRDSFLSF